MPASNKKNDFSKVVSNEKNERVARESLHDILVFQQSLDKEIKKLEQAKAKNSETDEELLKKMLIVKEHYKKVVIGFVELDDTNQRHTLTAYSDAVQDLITYLHRSGA